MGRDSRDYWTANQTGIINRIWSGIARRNSKTMVSFSWADFKAATAFLASISHPKQILHGDDRPVYKGVRHERSKPQQLANPVSSHSSKERSEAHTIFPGSPTPDAAHVQSKSWDESEWID